MCGVGGIVNRSQQPVQVSDLQKMMKAMKHRGPDDEGTFIDKNLGLAHVRLSIFDLSSAGRQPMLSPSGRYQISYNGEIYNFLELREELRGRHQFKTNTDTEVLLAAFDEWGIACLDRLNGMFAFALYDTKEKTLFLVRDRFGIKPLYYFQDDKKFIFASDVPPLLTQMSQVEANDQTIYDFLVFDRTNYSENTFFKNVKKLKPGHYLTLKDNRVEITRWYNLREKTVSPLTSHEEFIDLFDEAIQLQLRSDVPVGACLSGGLDSSAIVSMIMRAKKSESLHTFSAVYGRGKVGDESQFIDCFKGSVKEMHFAYPTSQTLFADLERFVETLVEPLPGTSEYAEFKVMEEAKEHVTVILNGQGADELLAGYLYFAGYFYKDLFKRGRWLKLISEIQADHRNHKSREGLMAFGLFMLPGALKDLLLRKRGDVLARDFVGAHSASKEITQKLYASKNLHQSFIDHFEYKFEHNLIWADKAGMKFSLETRFPFLDHNLVEKLLTLDAEQIIHRGENKFFLRQAMRGILPEAIRQRKDKVGFATPEDEWFREPKFKEIFHEVFGSQSFKARPYFDQPKVMQSFNKHQSGDANIGPELWKWLHVELWLRKFVDSRPAVH